MNVAFAFNPASFARVSSMPTQQQITHQGAMCGTATARDSVQRVSNQKSMAKLTGARAATKNVFQLAAKVGKKGKA